jgi:putative transposase
MSDNGAAMTATEITEGLARLGILHQTTLPYSPYVNVAPKNMWRTVFGCPCGGQSSDLSAT